MLKRITIISTVLLVNIILLASIIIPHHHHEEEVCIINTHCHADKDSHTDDLASHEHEADNSGHCTLNQTFIVPSAEKQVENTFVLAINLLSFIDVDYDFEVISSDVVLIQHPPEINSSYSTFIIQTKGLRGPPLV